MKEEFKICGCNENYLISNHGRVYSNLSGKFLRPVKHSAGYLVVTIKVDNQLKKMYTHRLVASHFVDGYFEGAEVNHIDFNRSNNHYTNLEWVSSKENSYHSRDRIFKATEQACANNYLIIYPDGKKETIFNLNKFCKDNDLHQAAMWRVSSGAQNKHKGFKCIKLGT